ncbi:uncharacterized protein L201_006171 [Kwoniella dendrophila CBS 6074]|uniref:Uncharacterized protein n=1 Tax=Kwoniella dendrophila CBS 6074 TaxID=1295534 RepID=A0AAX4K1G9_9TREE
MTSTITSVSQNLLNGLKSVLVDWTKNDVLSKLSNSIPRPLKYLIAIIFILQAPSWPFIWHFRIFNVASKLHLDQLRKGRSKYINDSIKTIEQSSSSSSSSGSNGGLEDFRVRYNRLAWFDDCDYRLHLSNSAYAKNSDPIEMKFGMKLFEPLLGTGAYLALGSSHYNFFKEIPFGKKYIIETRIGGWDEKWLYLVSEFIIYPKSNQKSSKSKAEPIDAFKKTHTSGSSTPAGGPEMPKSKIEEIKKSWVNKRSKRQDGGIICCLAISEYCLKIGRITVPPRIGLWTALRHSSKIEQEKARKIIMGKDCGYEFLTGGWRNEENATTLGVDIAFEDVDGNWVKQGKENMEAVVKGLSGFYITNSLAWNE